MRKAFTLIEVLIVIGVITILTAMLFEGIKIVGNNTRGRDTAAALETAKTMWENYKQATDLQRYPQSDLGKKYGAAYWQVATADASQVPNDPTAWWSGNNAELLRTAYVMAALESIPENQKIIAALPSRKVATTPVGSTILLDGWGNPIIFVPAGGLVNASPSASSGAILWASPGADGIMSNGNDNIYSNQ